MSLLTECKVYLDITDDDRNGKLTQLLKSGYSSMTNTADVVAVDSFDPTSDSLQLDDLIKTALFKYVAMELETDPDTKAKYNVIYERQVNALAMSSAFGDFSALPEGG